MICAVLDVDVVALTQYCKLVSFFYILFSDKGVSKKQLLLITEALFLWDS